MGLLPLEFSDCLLDSPYFRENLRAHERQLDQTSADIKGIAKDIGDVLEAADRLSKAKRTLASNLAGFRFDCIGTSLTDDEVIIANSLREFSRFLLQVEDEMDRMLENATDKFLVPLETFRKEQIGSVKKTKKEFEKQTARFCAAQDRYAGLSSKKEDSLAEALEAVRTEKRTLNASSLEYIHLMHMVQERKKFEFVEAIVSFMQAWTTYYRHGQSVASDYSGYMDDLKSRVQKTRDNYSATMEKYEGLKEKMRTGQHQDPGMLNKMYTRQGYLYAQNNNRRNNIKIGSHWTKYYCQYVSKTKVLTMIPYSQLSGKITTTETLKVHECLCKEETTEKYRFVVTGEDLSEQGSIVTHTFQAMSDFERKHWVEAMGGTWPNVSTLQKIKADSIEDNLNSVAFAFLKDCLAELEARGLRDEGLYRVGGVVSKVKKLLSQALDPDAAKSNGNSNNNRNAAVDISDPKVWESKTLASAVKQYFRDLNKPLMTYSLYGAFVEAAKHESDERRLQEVDSVLRRLPGANREVLKVLIRHLHKVSSLSNVNLMTSGNLGVVFGPTLLWPREETVASIVDTKFCNEVVEILIENCDTFFPPKSSVVAGTDSSPDMSAATKKKNSSPAAIGDNTSTANGDEPDGFQDETDSRNRRGSSTPKRTQSLSAFSLLSTNSLPDIKEFRIRPLQKPRPQFAVISDSSSRFHREPRKSNAASTASSSSEINFPPPHMAKQTSSLPTTTGENGHPPPQPLMKSLTQDDLMASLEMMNTLAADLPSSTPSFSTVPRLVGGGSPLKRSLTLQPRSGNDVVRKPPLPKLSLGSLPDESRTNPSVSPLVVNNGNGSSQHQSLLQLYYRPTGHHLHNSSPSPSVSSDSNAASPRIMRDQGRMLIAEEEDVNNVQNNGSISQQHGVFLNPLPPPPPAVPTRKYRRIVVSPGALQEHAAKVATGGGIVDLLLTKSTASVDSGMMSTTSPSPPNTANAAAAKPDFDKAKPGEDTASVSSSALSVGSAADTASVGGGSSNYDDNNAAIGNDKTAVDGGEEADDEAAASEASSFSSRLVLDSSGNEDEADDSRRREMVITTEAMVHISNCDDDKDKPDLVRQIPKSSHNNRVSTYENVSVASEDDITTTGDEDDDEVRLSADENSSSSQQQQQHHLDVGRILTAAQTSDV